MTDRAPAREARGTVWFVTRKYPPATGGMERLSFELTRRLSGRRPARIIARCSGSLAAFMLRSAFAIVAGARTRSIAVLHLGDPVLSPLGVLARWWHIPVCVTVHGLDVLHDSAAYRCWLRLFFRRLDRYVCISETARTAAIARGAPRERTEVIGIGVEVPPTMHQPRDPRLLLYLGRLTPRKGVGWFVSEVLPGLVGRQPELRLALIGKGPERAAIEQAARRAGVASRIEWLGEVAETSKWEWLARAAVCVMPNIPIAGDVEGYGIVAIEAAAAGTPLVASDIDGLHEALAGGEGGMLLPPLNAMAWVAAISNLLETPHAARARGEHAREWAKAARGWNSVCERYEKVFNELAAAR